TQPIRMARWPASEARNWPQVCVRRSSPRKSRGTDSMFLYVLHKLFTSERDLLARRHIFYQVCSGGDLIVSQDQSEARADLVGDFERPLELAIDRPFHRDSCRAKLGRQCSRMLFGCLAQWSKKHVHGGTGVALDTHHQAVFANRKSDPGRRNARTESLRQSVIAAAAQNRVLGSQRSVSDLKGGAHVVI